MYKHARASGTVTDKSVKGAKEEELWLNSQADSLA